MSEFLKELKWIKRSLEYEKKFRRYLFKGD
jgi:hypothetical protein